MIAAAGYVGTVTGLCGRAEDCRDANVSEVQRTTNDMAKIILEKARNINILVDQLHIALSGPREEKSAEKKPEERKFGVNPLLAKAYNELDVAIARLEHGLILLGEPAPVD